MMDLRRMRYFATTASEGSLHRAAERLHIAQPALSRQIRELEEELSVVLFIRSSKGVTLSPAGEVFLAEVERLLPQIEVAKTRAKRAEMGQFGLLRVAFTSAAAELRPAMAAFAAATRSMADIEFRLDLITSDHQPSAIMRGEIDVGLLHRRAPHPPELRYHDLRIDRYQLLVPDGHRLTKLSRVTLADLVDEDMVFGSMEQRPITYRDLMGACLRGGLVPRVVLQTDCEAFICNVVAEGIAISFCNSSLAQRGRTEGVTFLTVEDLDIPLQLSVMWKSDRETPAIINFVDLLDEHIGGDDKNG